MNLDNNKKDLEDICSTFDPFDFNTYSEDILNILLKYNIIQDKINLQEQDPFEISNKILKILHG